MPMVWWHFRKNWRNSIELVILTIEIKLVWSVQLFKLFSSLVPKWNYTCTQWTIENIVQTWKNKWKNKQVFDVEDSFILSNCCLKFFISMDLIELHFYKRFSIYLIRKIYIVIIIYSLPFWSLLTSLRLVINLFHISFVFFRLDIYFCPQNDIVFEIFLSTPDLLPITPHALCWQGIFSVLFFVFVSQCPSALNGIAQNVVKMSDSMSWKFCFYNRNTQLRIDWFGWRLIMPGKQIHW